MAINLSAIREHLLPGLRTVVVRRGHDPAMLAFKLFSVKQDAEGATRQSVSIGVFYSTMLRMPTVLSDDISFSVIDHLREIARRELAK